MASKATGTETFVVRPSRGYVALVLLAAAVAGPAELAVTRVELDEGELRIRTLTRRERVVLAEADSAKLDGGLTVIRMKDQHWVKLPDWVGADLGLRNRILARINRA